MTLACFDWMIVDGLQNKPCMNFSTRAWVRSSVMVTDMLHRQGCACRVRLDLVLARPASFDAPSTPTRSPHLPSQQLRHELRVCIVAMPLPSMPRGSTALRSARASALCRQCRPSAGAGTFMQRRWKSGDQEKPFYLQLNESIFDRVQKEKAEQIRIQSLQQRTARGQFFATVFGTDPSYSCLSQQN